MKRRGPRTKWQRIVREVVFELLIGGVSLKVGMGAGRYRYDSGGVKTAIN